MGEGEPKPTISKQELMKILSACEDNTKAMVLELDKLGIPHRLFTGYGAPETDSGRRGGPPTNLTPHAAVDHWGRATGSFEGGDVGARYVPTNEEVGQAVYDDGEWWVIVYKRTDITGQVILCIKENEYNTLT